MASDLDARSSQNAHKTQHKPVIRDMELTDIIIITVVVLVGLALLDVQTGVSFVDEIIQAVPIDWFKEVVNV